MSEFFWRHDAAIKFVLFLLLSFLALWIFVLSKNLEILYQALDISPSTAKTPKIDSCGEKCQEVIDESVAQAFATISAQPAEKIVTPSSGKFQTTYIPLGSSFSTKKRDWTDVTSSDFYLVKEDYGKDAYFNWEPSIKVGYGGGQVSTRIFDVTNGIAVDGSEVTATAQASTQVSSGSLNFWSGRNLYRVQIKSLNGYEVFYDSGRLKVYYK